jgi:hypothetical protein
MVVFVAGRGVVLVVVGPPSSAAGFCYACFSNVVGFFFFTQQEDMTESKPARRQENLCGFCGRRHISNFTDDEIGSSARSTAMSC